MVQVHGGTQLVVKQWGLSQSDATNVTLHLSVNNGNYKIFVAFKDWTGNQEPRMSYMAAINQTSTAFQYGQSTSVPRIWLLVSY